MGRINTVLQDLESFQYFRSAVYSSYGNYTSYKYIEGIQTWHVYTEFSPEILLTYTIKKGSDEEEIFLLDKSTVDSWVPRKRVDANVTDFDLAALEAEHYNQLGDAIHTIRMELDGYHPDITGTEHYHQHSTALSHIVGSLDGYASEQTELEHHNQHSDAIQYILKDLDGYNQTIQEHYNQYNQDINTILKDLDGYIPLSEKGEFNGVATLDSGGKVPASQIPAVALPQVHVVYDDTERLELDVQEGDEAIQVEDGYHYIYDGYDWYVRPVNPHSADHYQGGEDEIIAQNLGSGDAEQGQILVADGDGGWSVENADFNLSNITYQFSFVKNGTINDAWLSLYEGTNYSNESPAIIPFESKLIGISFTNDNMDAGLDLKIYKSSLGTGNATSLSYTWSLTNVRVAYKTNFSESIIFNPGDKIGLYHDKTGNSSKDVTVILYLQVTNSASTGSGSENYNGNF